MEHLIGLLGSGATSVVGPWGIDAGILVLRIACGLFFAVSGAHKLFNAQRHAALVETFKRDKVPFIGFNQWWVPFWELTGGFMVLLGVFAPFGAFVLFVICSIACACEAKERVDAFKPIDRSDRLDDYLYLPEVLYCAMLVPVMLMGPGRFAIVH